jgi:chemotaxis protein CheZ
MSTDQDPGLAAAVLMRQLDPITRQLHEVLQQLQQLPLLPGLQRCAEVLPDARQRLDYVARKCGAAAERVIDSVEQAKLEQHALRATVQRMQQCQDAMPAAQVHALAAEVAAASARVDQRLTDILLAQDFHDLTGQVLAKTVALVVELEAAVQRLQPHRALHETTPGTASGLSGPVLASARAGGATDADVLHSQPEVDALLAGLGL